MPLPRLKSTRYELKEVALLPYFDLTSALHLRCYLVSESTSPDWFNMHWPQNSPSTHSHWHSHDWFPSLTPGSRVYKGRRE